MNIFGDLERKIKKNPTSLLFYLYITKQILTGIKCKITTHLKHIFDINILKKCRVLSKYFKIYQKMTWTASYLSLCYFLCVHFVNRYATNCAPLRRKKHWTIPETKILYIRGSMFNLYFKWQFICLWTTMVQTRFFYVFKKSDHSSVAKLGMQIPFMFINCCENQYNCFTLFFFNLKKLFFLGP